MNTARPAAAVAVLAVLGLLAGCQFGSDASPDPHAPCPSGYTRSHSGEDLGPVLQYACYPDKGGAAQ